MLPHLVLLMALLKIWCFGKDTSLVNRIYLLLPQLVSLKRANEAAL